MGILDKLFKPNIRKMRKEGDVEGLLDALDHSDHAVRQKAISALEGILREMTSLLSDRRIDTQQKIAAIELVRRISSKSKVNKIIMKMLRDEAVEPIIETLHGIEGVPYGGRMFLLYGIRTILENIGDPRVIKPLQKASESLEEDEQSEVKETIEKIQRMNVMNSKQDQKLS